MSDLTEIPLPLYRRVLERLAPTQDKIADKLVQAGAKLGQPLDILPFIPYFLTGGHDTANAMRNIAREGLDRPNRYGKHSGKVRAAMDALTASQLATYYAPIAIGSKLAMRGAKGALNKLIGDKSMDTSRRDFLKGSAALAGAGAIGAATPKVVKSVGKLLDEPLLGKSVADEVASVAPTVVKNGFSLADKLAMMEQFTKNRLWNIDGDLLAMARKGDLDDPDALDHFINDVDLEDYPFTTFDDILTLVDKTPEQWAQLAKAQEAIESTSIKQAFIKTHGEDEYLSYLNDHADPAYLDRYMSDTPMSNVFKEWDHEYGWHHDVPLRKGLQEYTDAPLSDKMNTPEYHTILKRDEQLGDIIWGKGEPDSHWLLRDYPDMADVIWASSNQ